MMIEIIQKAHIYTKARYEELVSCIKVELGPPESSM